jgi:hypothetical protein
VMNQKPWLILLRKNLLMILEKKSKKRSMLC